MKLVDWTVHDGTASGEVLSDTGNSYVVTATDDGEMYCACHDQLFRQHQCKHIKFVLEELDRRRWKEASRDPEVRHAFDMAEKVK